MNNNLYYFNKYDLAGCDELKDRVFTYNQLQEVFRDVFQKELLEMGDTETTFESWLNDNLKMHLIFKKE